MSECWAPVAGWDRYEVSDHGRVRNSKTGHVMATSSHHRGYRQVHLFRPKAEGRPKTFKIHRLVAIAFIPNPERRPEVNHIDHDKANNHVGNLEWVTGDENMLAGMKAGRRAAITNPNRRFKITPEAVAAIRAEYKPGVVGSAQALADRFGIHSRNVRRIATYKSWRNPEDGPPPGSKRRPSNRRISRETRTASVRSTEEGA